MCIAIPAESKPLYELDFYQWTRNQADWIQKGEFEKLDKDRLREELEALGNREKQTLESYLQKLLMHMLKVRYQPQMHTNSWDLSIKIHDKKAKKVLFENPSLKPKLKEIFLDAYEYARLEAAAETGLPLELFPELCEWSIQEVFPDLEKKYLSMDWLNG